MCICWPSCLSRPHSHRRSTRASAGANSSATMLAVVSLAPAFSPPLNPRVMRGLSLLMSSTSATGGVAPPPGGSAAASYETLKGLLREVSTLAEVSGILGYDEQCFMSEGSAASRAAQKEALAGVIHEKRTSTRMAEVIDAARVGERARRDRGL